MDVLILGGTGAMGVHLVQMMAEMGCEVYVTSRKTHSTKKANIHYIQGNAHDKDFLREILRQANFDAIVDFMVYQEKEFADRIELLLEATKQYIFISSCRVYADSKAPITENTPRLLDVTEDSEYLKTEEYALTKARQEDLLQNSLHKNWTIIRPYITYSEGRLQLGMFEKEQWLYRALHGRTIIFSKDVASKLTTLTYGCDVAGVISKLIGKDNALGECVHIVAPGPKTWQEIMDIYLDVLEKINGKRPKVMLLEDFTQIEKVMNNQYQLRYDRMLDRVFDNSKVEEICGQVEFIDVLLGVQKCLKSFLEEKRKFHPISWRYEAVFDRITGERTPLKEIPTFKSKIRYLAIRYFNLMK